METIFLIIGGIIALGLLIGVTEFCVGGLSGWHKLVALLAAIAGGVVGYLDEQIPGAVGGGGLGGLAGYLMGGILFGVINSLRLSGSVRDEAEPPRKQVSLPERIILSIFRLIAVAILAIVSHELYWLVNVAALVGNFGAGIAIANESAGNATEAAMQTAANEVRWRASVFSARPIRWCVTDEIAVSNKRALELVDSLGNRSQLSGANWQDDGQPIAGPPANEILSVDEQLHSSAAAICLESLVKIDTTFQRGWFIKHIPVDWALKQIRLTLPPTLETEAEEPVETAVGS